MIRRKRLLAITLTLAISNLTLGSVAFGRSPSRPRQELKTVASDILEASAFQPEAVTQAQTFLQTQEAAQTVKEYSPQELEELRSKFLELIDGVKKFADLVLSDNPELSGKLDQARKQFEQFSSRELTALRATVDPATMNNRLAESLTVLEEYRPSLERARDSRLQRSKFPDSSGVRLKSGGFPGAPGPDAVCDALVGSGRPSAALIISTETVFIAASVVKAVASRGCNQVLVALGVGGNSSAACIATDAIYFVAKAVRDKVLACDLDWAKRTIDGTYQRLGHLHSDLETSIANDGNNKTALTNEATANTTTITTAISNAQTAVVNNANSNLTTVTNAISNAQTAIINNDNTNKNTIVANDNANKNTIVANDNANAAMLRDLLLRTQIEADLASTDSATFVGLYIAPASKGGYLELVRSIVVLTITNLGGANTAQANALRVKGDAFKAAGNFKEAYKNYRLAYKKATG